MHQEIFTELSSVALERAIGGVRLGDAVVGAVLFGTVLAVGRLVSSHSDSATCGESGQRACPER